MQATFWAKISAKKTHGRWTAGPISTFKTKPATADNEIAVKMTIEIPDSVFEEPVFEASITLPETVKNFPEKTEVAKHIGDALSKKTGFKVKVDMGDEGAFVS